MARKNKQNNVQNQQEQGKFFRLEYKTPIQKIAHQVYYDHDITFLTGAAGTGKTILSLAFAGDEILKKQKQKIILTRPIVEAGENLGFLPGSLDEKVAPYLMPFHDNLNILFGKLGYNREIIDKAIEIAPLAYLRGRSLNDAVCILDEAQNCSFDQLILFITRLGNNSKMIITGDPYQSDLYDRDKTPLVKMIDAIGDVPGVGVVHFPEKYILRHAVIGRILNKLKQNPS